MSLAQGNNTPTRPRIEPGSPDPEPDALTTRPVRPPEFYSDLVYKFEKVMGRTHFSDQFRKVIISINRIGFNLNVMRQSACLVINPITVYNFAALFNCAQVVRASDSMKAPT